MTWKKLADIILKKRVIVLSIVILLSVFMGYNASKVRITFAGGKVLPLTDSAYIRYNEFRKIFGQDASTMVIGFRSSNLFNREVFNDWYRAGLRIGHIKGIKSVISMANLYNLTKDTVN